MAELNSQSRFPGYVQFRAPERVPEALAVAADKKLTTVSEYLRQTVIEKLKADGFGEMITS